MKRSTPLLAALLATFAVLGLSGAAIACPMCKDSVANTDAGVAAGFNNSIYFMLLGFFGCLALVARTIVKGIRGSTLPPGFPVQSLKQRPPQDPDDRNPDERGPRS